MMKKILFAMVIFFTISCNITDPKKKSEKLIENNVDIIEKDSFLNRNNPVQIIDSNRCNIKIVLEVDEKMDNLTSNLVYWFLYAFDESCVNNAEFGEYSNEVLFKLVYSHPDLIGEHWNKREIKKGIIMNELSNPVTETISKKDAYNSVVKSNLDLPIKKELFNALSKE